MPDVYMFSSSSLTNIWAGIGAKRWALSKKQSENASIRAKAKTIPLGAIGLFYSVETKALTTPFIVASRPDMTNIASSIWSEDWYLPFSIVPFGNPHSQCRVTELQKLLPDIGARTWNQYFFVTPIQAFAASKLTNNDWSSLIPRLLSQG